MISRNLSLLVLTALDLAFAIDPSSIHFTGGTIIAFDHEANDLNVIRNGSILIEHDRITGIWSNDDTALVSIPPNATVIDAAGKIIAPGFVDTHRHNWQTLYKTMFSNITLIEYFARFGEQAAAGRIDAEQVYIGTLNGIYESLNAGTTTSLDHAHHTWSDETSWAGLNASINSGARVFWSYAIRNVVNYTIEQQIVNYRDILNAVPQKGTPVELGIAFDGFDNGSVDPETIASIVDLAKSANVSVITTHSGGGVYGSEFLLNGGKFSYDLAFIRYPTNPMSVVQAFLMATRNGGLALRRPDLGVLSVGAKADVVVWDGTSSSLLGWVGPVAAIILHSNVGDVEHVLVDGKFVKRDFKLVIGDYGQVKSRFLEASKRVRETWRQIPRPELGERTSEGALIANPDQVDVTPGAGTGYGQLYIET